MKKIERHEQEAQAAQKKTNLFKVPELPQNNSMNSLASNAVTSMEMGSISNDYTASQLP